MRRLLILLLLFASVCFAAEAGLVLELDIISPSNTTYEYSNIEVKVYVSLDQEFVDQAEVTGKIGIDSFEIPQGANYYWTTREIESGRHELRVTASYENMTAFRAIPFIVSAPGSRIMEMHMLEPTQGQYPLGYEGKISVFFTDATGVKMRNENISITATIKTPTREYTEELDYKDDLLVPKYSKKILFSESGYYYISVEAELKDHQAASGSYSPILVGEQDIPLPEGTECDNGICINIMEPQEYGTYAIAEKAEMRAQIIEEEGNHNPVQDAVVTATIGEQEVSLEYEYNGMYVGALPRIEEGTYDIEFSAGKDDKTVSKSRTIFISPHALGIRAVYPKAGDNVTIETTTLQVEVTDEAQDVVPGANVLAVVTSPTTGAHTIPLARNVENGYYEALYTFSDAGQHSMKVTASKQGYVSGELHLVFNVAIVPDELVFKEKDLLIVFVSLGILIILITVGRALI